jgi:hypothetical protein
MLEDQLRITRPNLIIYFQADILMQKRTDNEYNNDRLRRRLAASQAEVHGFYSAGWS